MAPGGTYPQGGRGDCVRRVDKRLIDGSSIYMKALPYCLGPRGFLECPCPQIDEGGFRRLAGLYCRAERAIRDDINRAVGSPMASPLPSAGAAGADGGVASTSRRRPGGR